MVGREAALLADVAGGGQDHFLPEARIDGRELIGGIVVLSQYFGYCCFRDFR